MSTSKHSVWFFLMPLLVVYLVFGTAYGSIRLSVSSIPWALVPCMRFLIAGLLLLLFCALRQEALPSFRDVKTQAIAGLLLFTGGNTLVCWAIQYIPSGLAGLLVSTLPFWMLGLSTIIPPRESVPPGSLIGMLMGFAGMVLLLLPHLSHSPGNHPVETPPLFWWTVLAMCINTFFWALGSIYVRKNPSRLSFAMRVGIQTFTAGVSMIPICLFTTPSLLSLKPTETSLWSLAYLIVICTCLAGPAYLMVMQRLPVAVASSFAYVAPVLTVLFGWLFLKEELSAATIRGMTVIIAGVVLVQWTSFLNRKRLLEQATAAKSAVAGQPPGMQPENVGRETEYAATATASGSGASSR